MWAGAIELCSYWPWLAATAVAKARVQTDRKELTFMMTLQHKRRDSERVSRSVRFPGTFRGIMKEEDMVLSV